MEPQPAAPDPGFEEIYEAHASRVLRTLRRLGVREADLEDVAQEVFVVVHRKLPEFAGRSSLKTWLFGICVRVASGFRQRAHVQRESLGQTAPERANSGELAVRSIALKQARVQLDALLDRLDEDKRTVFVLFELEQFSMAEVGETLGVPQQTAWSRLYAARKFIEAAVSRHAEAIE
ncbi:MAG: RNA polymerase sigma factor [Archangium sp.]|nr:RNA polymerase sigma factor [Archangium sp.]